MVRLFLPKPFLQFGIFPLKRVRERLPTLEVNLDDVIVEKHLNSLSTSEQSDGEIVPTQTVPTVRDFPAEQGQRTLTNSRSKSDDEVVERHLDSSGTSEQSLDQGMWTVV